MVSSMSPAWMISTVPVLVLLFLRLELSVGEPTTTVPKFLSGAANITLTNDTFTGRTTVIALTSPANVFELALIQDGFGTDTKLQYCWAAVRHVGYEGSNPAYVYCSLVKVDGCSLVLTSAGELRMKMAANGNDASVNVSDTGGHVGAVDVHLSDDGYLELVKDDNTSVWHSYQRQRMCLFVRFSASSKTRPARLPFPFSDSSKLSFAWFCLACSICLSFVMALST